MADLASIHGKSVMMFRGNDDVLHTRIPGDEHPLGSVELNGIELRRKLLVIRAWDVGPFHNPLANSFGSLAVVLAGGNGIQTPVDEHSEACFAPPSHAAIAFGFSFWAAQRSLWAINESLGVGPVLCEYSQQN